MWLKQTDLSILTRYDVCVLGSAVLSFRRNCIEEEVAVRQIIKNMPVGMEWNIYCRLIVNSEVIHCTDYLRPVRSNDTVVLLNDGTFGIESYNVLLKETCWCAPFAEWEIKDFSSPHFRMFCSFRSITGSSPNRNRATNACTTSLKWKVSVCFQTLLKGTFN